MAILTGPQQNKSGVADTKGASDLGNLIWHVAVTQIFSVSNWPESVNMRWCSKMQNLPTMRGCAYFWPLFFVRKSPDFIV